MRPRSAPDDWWEWTVGEAPFAEAPEAGPDRPQPAAEPRLSDGAARAGWWAAGVVAAGLLVWGLNAAWTQFRRELDLRQVVAREEQAAVAGDAVAVRALSEPADWVWLEQRLDRILAGQPAPAPLNLLTTLPAPGQILTLTLPAPDLARVEMVRTFTDPAGRHYRFALPQFYRSTPAGWRRVAPPEDFWGEPRRIAGQRVVIWAPAVDEAWARASLPALDGLLDRFCAEVGCPLEPITLTLSHNSYLRPDRLDLQADDPLLLGLLPPVVSRFPSSTLLLPAPHDVGYPLDPAGQALLLRAVGVQLLYTAADRAVFGPTRLEQVGNIYFFALVARLEARYGLEPAAAVLDAGPPAADLPDSDELWGFQFGAWRRPDLIRHALGQINGWLAGQPPEAELSLLRALGTARSLSEWLRDGLAPDAWARRWPAAGWAAP